MRIKNRRSCSTRQRVDESDKVELTKDQSNAALNPTKTGVPSAPAVLATQSRNFCIPIAGSSPSRSSLPRDRPVSSSAFGSALLVVGFSSQEDACCGSETLQAPIVRRLYWGRPRKRKKSYAKRALMPPRRGIGRTHGKRCLKVCNAASLSVFSDEQHGFFGVDFVMRNVQLEVLRIHQRSTTRNLQ